MINSHKKHCIYVIYLNAIQRESTHVGFTERELADFGILFGNFRWKWAKL